jgi:hypothetical protein
LAAAVVSELSVDPHGPCFGVDRLPDAQVEIDLELARFLVVGKRLTKAGLEHPLTGKLHIETETAEELGQVMRLREVADLDLDAAKLPLDTPQTPLPPSKCGQAARLVKAGPS